MTNTIANAWSCDHSPWQHLSTHIVTLVTAVWEVLYHPPYSFDPSHLDYNLFQKLKEKLQGIHFINLSKLSSTVAWEIRWDQLLHGIQRLLEYWWACTLYKWDFIEELYCNFSLKLNFFVFISNSARFLGPLL